MKIKNLTIFSVSVALLCTALRTIALLYVTEEKTGFFKTRLSNMGIFLTIIIFVLAAVAVAFAFSAKEKPVTPYKPSALTGMLFIVFGITVIIAAVTDGGRIYTASWQKTAEILTGILAGGWFMLFGASTFKKLTIPPVCAVLPCLHFIIRLIIVFTDYSTAALVAEHVLSLAYHCFIMIFMLFLGRNIADVASKKHSALLFPIGIATLIFSFTSVISRVILALMEKEQLIHGEMALDTIGMVFCLLIVVLLLDMFRKNNNPQNHD